MKSNIKNQQLDNLYNSFKSITEKVMEQFSLAINFFETPTKDGFKQIEELEKMIDLLENEVSVEYINSLLMNPRAKDLRKIVSYQDVSNFTEKIGDLLFNIAKKTKRLDKSISDFEDFYSSLKVIFEEAKKIINDSFFSFFYEDKEAAQKIISNRNPLFKPILELRESITEEFSEIPMSAKELQSIMDIIDIANYLSQIASLGKEIADSSVYLKEGVILKHSCQ
jgi:Phosphate uptake regulator